VDVERVLGHPHRLGDDDRRGHEAIVSGEGDAPVRFDAGAQPWRQCGRGDDHMRTATLREFRDRASTLLRGAAPVLVTRRGRIVGFFVPTSGTAVPLDIKRKLFYAVTSAVRRMVRSRGLSEKAIIADFEAPRKTRRRR